MLNVSYASLEWALNHALTIGDSDMFPRAFEFEAIDHDREAVLGDLSRSDALAWPTRTNRRCLAPKGRYGFRVATQLDPLDFLLYSALIYDIGKDLERARMDMNRSVVFSHRFAPDSSGRMFDPSVGYAQFLEESDRLSGASDVTHVAVADIADFYQRLYHHPIENAMDAATESKTHVRAIMKLLSGWTERVSYGIPVGCAASRVLAEVTIAGTDAALASQGWKFIRFNDDYRIFVRSHTEGYHALAFLAQNLFDVYGLTLQTQKTRVIAQHAFRSWYLQTPDRMELQRLRDQWRELAGELGIDSAYGSINEADLTPEQRQRIDSYNLPEMFREELASEEPDAGLLTFVLRRLTQRGTQELVDDVLINIDSLYQVLPVVIEYLQSVTIKSAARRAEIGARVLGLATGPLGRELEHNQMWLLELFATSSAWANSESLPAVLGQLNGLLVRRAVYLAMGRAHVSHWFASRRTSWAEESPWVRRALLAGASCMPPDQRKHWFQSVSSRLDPLERVVAKWVREKPF